jgi:hypothetical protein
MRDVNLRRNAPRCRAGRRRSSFDPMPVRLTSCWPHRQPVFLGPTPRRRSPAHSTRYFRKSGLIRGEGRGPAWTAKITAEGRRLLKEQARRVETGCERARREEEACAEREARVAATAGTRAGGA